MSLWFFLYLWVTVVVALIGVMLWSDNHRECDAIGARTFFLSPLWPLVALCYAAIYLCMAPAAVGRMWKDAGWKF